MMLRDAIPEKSGRETITGISSGDVARQRAQELGNLRVAMEPGQVILVAFKRVENGVVFETVREGEPAFVPRILIKVGQNFVHPAELRVQHFLNLRVAKFRKYIFSPACKLHFQFESHAVASKAIGITQPRKIFVEDIPWRPETIQVETAGPDLAARDLGKALLSVGQCAQVSISVCVLDLFQLRNSVIDTLFKPFIARGGPHE